MPKRPAGYYRPKQLDEALKLLANPDTIPLAGGTKLLAGDVEAAVVDLQDVGLDRIEKKNDYLHIGAMARLNDAVKNVNGKLFSNRADTRLDQEGLFQRALLLAGPNTYRNAATFGGVIASRLTDSELLVVMLVFEAELALYSPGESQMSLIEYLALEQKATGLITEVTVGWGAGYGSSHRVARTPADYPIVSVAAWLPEGGTVRLAASGLRDRPYRLENAESSLDGEISDNAIELAAAAAKSSTNHPGDFRGDSSYRADMAAVLLRRALKDIQVQLS
jgi:carbon-monoxide dehydrogenase medium subunit